MTAGTRRPVLFWSILVGIGVAGTVDEVLLHQVLHWHHFYDKTTDTRLPDTARIGLLTDGIFHLVSTALLVVGIVRLWRLGAERLPTSVAWAGILLGAGGFNLYDGVVQHKLLKLHQVREGAHPETPYDLVFIAVALVVFVAGWMVLRRSRNARAAAPS